MAINDKIVSKEKLSYFKSKLDANGYKNTIEKIHYCGYTGSEYDAPIGQDKKATLTYAAVAAVYGTPQRGVIRARTPDVPGQQYGIDIAISSTLGDTDFVDFSMYDTEAGDKVSVSKQLTTKRYVDANAGKINKIKVNGVEQTITNKEVDIDLTEYARVDGYTGGLEANGPEETDALGATYIPKFVLKKIYNIAPGGYNGISLFYGEEGVHSPVVAPSKEYVDATFRTEAQVAAAISEAQTGAFVKVASYNDLPEEGAAGKIYLVPNSGSGKNVYDEYIWCVIAMLPGGNGGESPVYGYEKIGTTAIDLSGYVQESDLNEITTAEIDAMFV